MVVSILQYWFNKLAEAFLLLTSFRSSTSHFNNGQLNFSTHSVFLKFLFIGHKTSEYMVRLHLDMVTAAQHGMGSPQ